MSRESETQNLVTWLFAANKKRVRNKQTNRHVIFWSPTLQRSVELEKNLYIKHDKKTSTDYGKYSVFRAWQLQCPQSVTTKCQQSMTNTAYTEHDKHIVYRVWQIQCLQRIKNTVFIEFITCSPQSMISQVWIFFLALLLPKMPNSMMISSERPRICQIKFFFLKV